MKREKPAAIAKDSKWVKAFEEGKKEDERLAAEKAAQKKAKEPLEPKAKGKAKASPKKPAPGQDMAKAEKPSKEKPSKSNYAGQATVEAASNLQKAYDYFNAELFSGKLSPMMIRLEPSKKFRGYYNPDRWSRLRGDEDRIDELVLNPLISEGRTDKDILSTLVHEMAHGEIERRGDAPRKPYHCQRWCRLMLELGLEPIIVNAKGEPTGKPTGKNATHKILKGERFDRACDWLLAEGYTLKWLRLPDPEPVKATKKKPKTIGTHVCPECDEKAKAKIVYKLTCGMCNVPMECDDVPDLPEDDGSSD